MSKLKKVLKEEMSRILEGASDRPDRMTPFEEEDDRGTRWYETMEDFSEDGETMQEAMRRVIAEEYIRYRDTSDRDVEEKLGIHDFEVKERDNRERWFEPGSEGYGKAQLDESVIEKIIKETVKNLTS